MMPQPISPYAVSKLAAEQYARAFTSVYGLETVSLRYFNVFGPRQDPTSQYSGVVPRFMRLAIQGGRPVVFGDGEQSRDFTYVANVVDATLSAATAAGAAGNICNIGCGDPKTVLDLIAAVSRVSGRPLEPEFAPPRLGDVKHSFADISLARKLLGYEPRVGFDEGIGRTFEWLVGDMPAVPA
jgi:UDP-glucose 4-epimerase